LLVNVRRKCRQSDANAVEVLKLEPNAKSVNMSPGKKTKVGPLPIGTVLLERFVLEQLIACGGTSYIFRARDTWSEPEGGGEQNQIAVKVARPDLEGASESEIMLCEALTSRHLTHPNIVNVYEYHRDGNIHFVTMELIKGETLAELLTRSPGNTLPAQQAMSIVNAIALALQAAHQQGVVHSDIKPGNILISNQGVVKVIDFSTARVNSELNNNDSSTFYGSGFHGYTLAYASPETVADKPACANDDVFSLACMTYEILTGKPPYSERNSDASSPDPRIEKSKNLNLWQWFVLKKGLALRANKRFASVTEFTQQLRSARRGWSNLGISFVVVFGVLVGVQQAMRQIEQYQANIARFESAFEQQLAVEKLVSEIKSEVFLNRAQKLPALDNVSELLRQGALNQLHDEIALPLFGHVEAVLNNGDNDQELPDFKSLFKITSTVGIYYPNSNVVDSSRRLVNVEYQRRIDTVSKQVEIEWERTDFSKTSITTIIELSAQLTGLDKTVAVYPGTVTVDRYLKTITAAMEKRDYVALVELCYFAENAPDNTLLLAQWESLDTQIFSAARLLAKYLNQVDHSQALYPAESVKFIVKPFLDEINRGLSVASYDSKIVALKKKMYRGLEIFVFPEDMDIYKDARGNLKKKLNRQIDYHRTVGNTNAQQLMEQVLASI
jgi:serine/threonine protein kinase